MSSPNTQPVRIAVAGVGLIGKRHVAAIDVVPNTSLACIIDPTDAGEEIAKATGARHYRTLADMLDTDRPDGIILATPNQMHVKAGLKCIAAGIPTLIEKPIATDTAGAQTLVDAANAANVPILTGHHRRYNPLIQMAYDVISGGELGHITSIQGQTWFRKPNNYFDVEWRSQSGAGPVFLNLIHDIDVLRYLCGDIASVHAMDSSAVRGFEVEDTAVILLRFASGALGTVNASDAIAAPWSWELTAKENPAYPATSEACYMIGGTKGSLSLPNLALWHHPKDQSWMAPISATRIPHNVDDPLHSQIEHFAEVIRGNAQPLVSGLEGLKTLRIIEAIKQSAKSGQTIDLSH
jgi:predicted dehydrogenase